MVIEIRPRVGRFQITKTDLQFPKLGGGDDDDAGGLQGPVRRICLVCKAQASSYACPRCATPYCSSACYKGHSRVCTEGFYRRHVENEIRLRDAEGSGSTEGKAAKKSTIEALRRVRLEGKGIGREEEWFGEGGGGREGALEDEDRLEELLSHVDDLDLDQLTEEEKKAFLAAIASGELGREVEVWRAWWEVPLSAEGKLLVSEAQEKEEEGGATKSSFDEDKSIHFPSLLRQVNDYRSSSSKEALFSSPSAATAPSPVLPYHLLDILFAYVSITRTYNGCWRIDPSQALQDLLAISHVLSASGSSTTAAAAALKDAFPVSSVLTQSLTALRARDLGGPDAATSMGLALVDDVLKVLDHKTRVLCVLMDLSNLIRCVVEEEIEGAGEEGGQEGGMEEKAIRGEGLGQPLSNLQELSSRIQQVLSSKEGSERKKQKKYVLQLVRFLYKLKYFMGWMMERQLAGKGKDLALLQAEIVVWKEEYEGIVKMKRSK